MGGGSAHNSNIFIPAMTSNANKLLRDHSLARQISRFFMLMISAQPGNLNPFEGVVCSPIGLFEVNKGHGNGQRVEKEGGSSQ